MQIQLRDGYKAYGGQVLLDHAQVTINDGMKIGIVGRNGAGKSTFCRVVLGLESLDSGDLMLAPGLRIAHLEQHDDFPAGETALDFLIRRSEQPDWRCGEVAGRFTIKGEMLERESRSLSGGYRTRLKLAAMLLSEPDVLLLDEPTNFLDLRTQLLLQDFLAAWRGTLMVVSHDRGLLRATCDHTLEVGRGQLVLEPGTVDAFYQRQQEEQERLERENTNTLARMKQLQQFIDSNRANANTAAQARNKQKQLDRLELHDLSGSLSSVHMMLPELAPRDGLCMETKSLAIGYGQDDNRKIIADDIDLTIDRGEKVVIFGDNGQGKTTLICTLTDSIPSLGGQYRWTHGAEVGVYAQYVYQQLAEEGTVIEYLMRRAQDGTSVQAVERLAGSFLFSGQAMHKSLTVLSGGERARVLLAGLLLGPYTVLILDEPTNHLDVETVDALGKALREWNGTVLCVTHDRDFATDLATSVIEVGNGTARRYDGGVAGWLWMAEQERQQQDPSSAPANQAGGGTAQL